MFMNRLLLIILGIAFSAEKLEAQESNKSVNSRTYRFHSFNTIQILNGSSTISVAINTVNGLKYKKFFCGIGTGFDYYHHTTVPLYLEARLDLFKRKGKLQLFGNGGLSIPFSSQNESKSGPYKTGSLYGAGLDYLVPIKKEAIIVGVAFSNKQVIQMVDNNIWNPVLNKVENIPIEEKYSLNRIAIRIGWMF